MYKFFLYIILIIAYLGLAKTLSPSEHGVQYLQNEKGFSKIIKGNPATVILVDTHKTGFLMETHYQKYRLISGYDNVEDLIVRTSKEFATKNKNNIGLSIYRRLDNQEEFLPLPPGSLYLGNSEYGDWKVNKKGITYWKFNKVFKNFPKYLGWGKFKPDVEFFQQMRSHISMNKPFLGTHQEFGNDGKVTRENFPHYFKEERTKKSDIKTLMIEYLKENF